MRFGPEWPLYSAKLSLFFGNALFCGAFGGPFSGIPIIYRGKQGSPSKTQCVFTHLEASKGPSAIHKWTFRVQKCKNPCFLTPGGPGRGGPYRSPKKVIFTHKLCRGNGPFWSRVPNPIFGPPGGPCFLTLGGAFALLEASKGPNSIHKWTFRVQKCKNPVF